MPDDAKESPITPASNSLGGGVPPVDLAHIEELIGGPDPAFVAEIMGVFVVSYTDLSARIQTALASGDAEALREAAHAAKGAAANAGAFALRNALLDLEVAARDGDLDLAALRSTLVDQQAALVLAWIAAWRKTQGQGA